MASESLRTPVEKPMRWHVYVGFCHDDSETANSDCHRLERMGLQVYPRLPFVKSIESIASRISDGVNYSQKCLLYLTSEYLKDHWSDIEMKVVLDKASRFSRDTVIVLVDQGDRTPVRIPDAFNGLVKHRPVGEGNDTETFWKTLADDISNAPDPLLVLPSKENIGYSAALSYFYGFLQLVLPDMKERMRHLISQEHDTEPNFYHQHVVRRMLIIIPESCFCPPSIAMTSHDGADKIEQTKKCLKRNASRSGREFRDYTTPIYQLTLSENEPTKSYYFAADIPAILLALYETYINRIASWTRDQLYQEGNGFFFSLKAILEHPSHKPLYHDQYKLLSWPDPESDNPNKSDLLTFLRHEILSEMKRQEEPDISSEVGQKANLFRDRTTFTVEDNIGQDPALRQWTCYKMDSSPRGICVIINNYKFDDKQKLADRPAYTSDREAMQNLFKRLDFEVRLYENLTVQKMETVMLEVSQEDHSTYDAFACVILSHGQLGEVYGADSTTIRILDLVEFFADKYCPSLTGKPKLFFIEACQSVLTGDASARNECIDLHLLQFGSSQQLLPSASLCGPQETFPVQESLPDSNVSSGQPSSGIMLRQETKVDQKKQATLVPGYPDFLMSYSTLPGSLAYGHPDTGGLYVQALSRHLQKNNTLEMLLKEVTIEVEQKVKELKVNEEWQLPFHLTTGMAKHVILHVS